MRHFINNQKIRKSLAHNFCGGNQPKQKVRSVSFKSYIHVQTVFNRLLIHPGIKKIDEFLCVNMCHQVSHFIFLKKVKVPAVIRI